MDDLCHPQVPLQHFEVTDIFKETRRGGGSVLECSCNMPTPTGPARKVAAAELFGTGLFSAFAVPDIECSSGPDASFDSLPFPIFFPSRLRCDDRTANARYPSTSSPLLDLAENFVE